MGRPTTYSPELVEKLLEHLEDGLCVSDVAKIEGMPKVRTVYQWMEAHPEFAQAYARAVEAGIRGNESELLAEARRRPVDSVDAQGQRTLVDALKWRLSKRLPRDFGDRQQVEHSGKVELPAMDDREAATRLAALLREAQRQQGG